MSVFQLFRALHSYEHGRSYERSYALRFGLNHPPHFLSNVSVFDGFNVPFLITSARLDQFEINKHCSQPSMQLRFGCLGRLALEPTISSKDSEHLGALDLAEVCQDCLETIQRIASPHHIFTTRSTPKIEGCEHPSITITVTKTCSDF